MVDLRFTNTAPVAAVRGIIPHLFSRAAAAASRRSTSAVKLPPIAALRLMRAQTKVTLRSARNSDEQVERMVGRIVRTARWKSDCEVCPNLVIIPPRKTRFDG